MFIICALSYRGIICKGSRYPPVIPRPTVNVFQWSIPICELETDKGRLEV